MGNRFGSDRGNTENDSRFINSDYSLGNGVSMEREYDRGFRHGYPDRMTGGRSFDEQKSFYGKGPKDYIRSADRIKEDICDALTNHDEIDASHIDVIVKGHEVILEGEVDGRDSKWLAEDIVDSTLGVNKVYNNLKVKRENSSGAYRLSEKAAREARDTDRS